MRTFQVVQPFAGLTVRENIAVGAHTRIAGRAAALAAAGEIAQLVGMGTQLDQSAGALTIAGRKRLELARALATGPRLLLLDEVMAGLNATEIADLVTVVRKIRDSGVTIFLIEHVMHPGYEPVRLHLRSQPWGNDRRGPAKPSDKGPKCD